MNSVGQLEFSRFDAAVFDLDGTLVHSEHAWEAAKLRILGKYGLSPSRELLDAHIGRGLNGFLDDAFERPLSVSERAEIGNEIGAEADLLLPAMRTPVPGASELLCKLYDHGLRIAICSSSPRRHIRGATEMLGICHRVEVMVSGAELPRGKPDPLPYLTVLELLGISPDGACAIEDSISGVISAQTAGLTVIAIGEGCTNPDFSNCAFQAESFDGLAG